jgi:hypothetical protein
MSSDEDEKREPQDRSMQERQQAKVFSKLVAEDDSDDSLPEVETP